MKNLEDQIRRLGRVTPSKNFLTSTKRRVMHQIQLEANETWFKKVLAKVGIASPSREFMRLARMRVMYRASHKPQSFGLFWGLFKRVMASTLVMALAVTSTLFFVDGKQYVSAADDSYLEVVSGNVTVKHADQITWDTVSGQLDVSAGDMVRLGENAQAVVHFFDDSQLRLAEDSLVLLNKISNSQGYARQGNIEVFLHQGRSWVQTLNIDDGYAQFKVITPDAILSTHYGSFDASVGFNRPTVVSNFKYGVNVDVLDPESSDIVASGKIGTGQKLVVESTNQRGELAEIADIVELTDDDKNTEWIVQNLQRDEAHLTALREREIDLLQQTAGALPGQMLYPVKLAKERLMLSFSFDEERLTQKQIDIANERLQEAILLSQQGQTQRAKEALLAYQSAARLIAEQARDNEDVRAQISKGLLAGNKKALVATLPSNSSTVSIRQVINQTEELLTDDGLEREQVRMKNDQERLLLIQEMVNSGNIQGAKDLLISHELDSSELLARAQNLTDDEQKKELLKAVLDAQNEELRLIQDIADLVDKQKVSDYQFVALLEAANKGAKNQIESTVNLVQPLEPDVVVQSNALSPLDKQVNYFIEKINIYSSWTGQKNQIARLFKLNPDLAKDMNFLTKLRDALSGRAREHINVKILQLSSEKKFQKDREIRRKIERNQRLRD